MLNISDAIRPYWAFGINNITVHKPKPFSKWLLEGSNYQIYNQILPDSFEISVSERKCFLMPISTDCNRFSMASLESAIKIEESDILPKALSWVLIKQYYSAFYAGHYILRILGYSLTQLDKSVARKIEIIANLYGSQNAIEIQKGFYLFDYSGRNNTINCQKELKIGEDGSHGIMWKLLSEKFTFISNDILQRNSSTDYQIISTKISDFITNLHYLGSNNGGWLSRIRNNINYKHEYGIWYPYTNYKTYYGDFHEYLNAWKANPMKIELSNLAGKELIRFISSCQFLISVAREISLDMSHRCSTGKSFQLNGPISLLNISKVGIGI